MQQNKLTSDDQIPHNLIAKNQFGTFFGVSQKILDEVWRKLTDTDANSVVYI